MVGGKNFGKIESKRWRQHNCYNGVDLHPLPVNGYDYLKVNCLRPAEHYRE